MPCLSSVLIYAMTGVGKTGQAGSWARWIRSKYGPDAVTLLVSAEPEGFDTIRHLINDGLIIPWDVQLWKYPSETLDAAANGRWPLEIEKPNSKLVPWTEVPALKGKKIMGVAFEGMKSIADWILGEMRSLGASNLIMSAEKAPAQYVSGATRYAGNNETHYGIAQTKIRDAVHASHRLPVNILWTTHEVRIKDKDTETYIFGPEVAGKAATLGCLRWFGHTIHLDTHPVLDEKTKVLVGKRRAYFVDHYDPNDPRYPFRAQVRVPVELAGIPGKIPQFWDLTANTMLEFMGMVEEWQKEAEALRLHA